MKITRHPEVERDLLAEQPEIGSPRSRGRRGFAMSVFPYMLVCKVFGEETKILVVKHVS